MPRHTIRELLTFACFFVLASVVWYGYSMGAVRSMVMPVTITYHGLSPIIQCEDSLPYTIEVEVRDAGHRLKSYRIHPLHIELDIRSQLQKEQGEIHIPADMLRNSISSILQGTTNLQVVQPDQITCSYHRQHKKSVPIRIISSFEPALQYQLVGKPTLLSPTITIFGNQDDINKIEEITTQPITLTDIKDTIVTTLPLSIPEGIQVNHQEVQVKIICERFTEKMITVPVQILDIPKGETVRIFPSEVNVMLRIGMSHFASLKDNQVQAVCYYPQHNQSRLPIYIQCSNRHVTYSRSAPQSVEYIIEK